ncbi:MAG: secretion system protein E, partial [Euryarchaeota archaeon]|nr:secretion system protein E [Euryarchaeota archaeon]
GSRIVMKLGREVSTRGSAFCIRRFKDDPFSPCDIIAFRTLSSLMGAYLWVAFQNEVPMLFVGGTASGKTTTLNAMCIFIPWQMKIVSIESTREVNIPQPTWVPGLTRQGFGGESNEGEIGEFELLKAALRERPEYIIVGEIRGAEAYVLFQAMATGHCAYSTVHADSVPSLVHRLENKPIDIPRVLLPALEACAIQIQTRINGRRVRRTKQIVEIVGIDPNSLEVITNEVFRWNVANDDFIFSGKSYVLEKIMVKINFSQDEMRRELRTRKRILEWMVLNDIRKADQVSQIITEYYVRPQEILARVDGLR